jgi:hypothetical protein
MGKIMGVGCRIWNRKLDLGQMDNKIKMSKLQLNTVRLYQLLHEEAGISFDHRPGSFSSKREREAIKKRLKINENKTKYGENRLSDVTTCIDFFNFKQMCLRLETK